MDPVKDNERKTRNAEVIPDTMLSESTFLREIAELTKEGVWVLDSHERITYVNSRLLELLGYTAEELIGNKPDLFVGELEAAAAIGEPMIEEKDKPAICAYEIQFLRKDNTRFQGTVQTRILHDAQGNFQGSIGIVSDDSYHIMVEKRLRQKNRSLKVLSESNQALIRATQERGLLQEICRIVVKVGGYFRAWVGYPLPNGTDHWQNVAFAELLPNEEELCDQQREIGENPLFRASVEEGRPFIIRDTSHESWDKIADGAWREQGVQCAIGLPLLDNKQIIGVLGILSQNEDAFNSDEVNLLLELANDLAYGILSLRAREERKKDREALRFTQFSIDHAIDPIYWVGEGGQITDANKAACEALGYSQEELLRMTVYDLDPMYTKEKWQKQFVILKNQGSVTFESMHRRKDGAIFPVEVTSNYLEYNDKIFSCAFVRDITERKRAETALRESEEKFRSLVESTNDLFWEVDENSRYSYVSPRVRDLLGYTPEEIIGRKPFDLMPIGEAKRIEEIFLGYVDRREAFTCIESVLIHKDGHHIIVETSGTPIISQMGIFKGYRGIDRDVTERRASEHELTISLEKLRRSIEGAVEAMALTVEMKDPYTAGHQRRVAHLAWSIAKGLGLSENQVEGVRLAAMVHDIGKIYVPAEILSKPGRISEIEFSLIQTHPRVGYDVLKTIEFPWPIAEIVLQHHERINGKGYPLGLVGEEILLEAKIISVADVVEAMSSHRPYRPAVGIEHALTEILEKRGLLYDPDVVDVCMELFAKGFNFEELTNVG